MIRRVSRGVAVIVLSLAATFTSTARAGLTYAELSIQSQPGDYVGQGQTKDIVYTAANSTYFSAQIISYGTAAPEYLSFLLGTVTGSNATNTFTGLDFGTNELNLPFQAGIYGLPGNTAQRAAFATLGHAGLDVSFQNRGSNTLTGNFTVNSVSFFTDVNNVLEIGSLDVNFEQHSEGATPALYGHFVYQNGSIVPEPGSIVLCGIASVVGLVVARVRRKSAA